MSDSDDDHPPAEIFNDDLSRDVDAKEGPRGGTAKANKLDGSKGEFWPEIPLKDRITRQLVDQVYRDAKPDYDRQLLQFTVDEAKKLFALTANTDYQSKKILARMKLFQFHRMTDNDLTAEIETPNGSSSDKTGLPAQLEERLPLISAKSWRSAAVGRFCSLLWKAVVPVFSTSRSNYNFKMGTILPFVELDRHVKSGAFSYVHKTAIYEGYYDDQAVPKENWPKYFAVKEIRPPDQTERLLVSQRWDAEANMLRKMNSRNSDHIVRFITAFTVGTMHCLMFEWADGGSLGDVWLEHPNQIITPGLVKDAVTQLLGLARAILAAHIEIEASGGTRHGDLKPENILRFGATPDKILGTLKIGDWGLAKYHNEATIARKERTTTRFFTVLYEAPEWGLDEPLGRQYDIWSMGVIILELVIWLLYGNESVERFKKEVTGSEISPEPCYIVSVDINDKKTAALRKVVKEKWIDHIAKDPSCEKETAMGELLTLIEEKLLVVTLPVRKSETRVGDDNPTIIEPNSSGIDWESDDRQGPSPKKLERATSEEFVNCLERMFLAEEDVENYWFRESPKGYDRKPPPEPAAKAPKSDSGHLKPASEIRGRIRGTSRQRSQSSQDAPGTTSLVVPGQAILDYKHPKLDDEWEFHLDNHFASRVISGIENLLLLQPPKLHGAASLCNSCQRLNIFNPSGFSVEYASSDLEAMSETCDLCRLFLRTYQRNSGGTSTTVRFERFQSSLRLNGRAFPVLSICRGTGFKSPSGIQIGLPELPTAGSPVHFEIIRQWLRACDDKSQHPICNATSRSSECLPTRLIEVGQEGDEQVRLWEPGPTDTVDYIALSHPWGQAPHFVTTVGNLDEHKKGIKVTDLPSTFKDAVITTRALGQGYLWIDSICIVQGPGGDFDSEAKKMEHVFSLAYCVIAASCARSHVDGFLHGPRVRDYVMIQKAEDGAPFYICEHIDNFDSHVLNGHLNKRGWVLQEHALARRTIFFTEQQTYWECGDGVRCETLTKMSNNLAAFLGDPNFPHIIMSASQGEKIIRFQNLYRTYSRLGFTEPTDRPIAVDGLENRLLRAFGACGGYGVFEEDSQAGLLRRSLLWYRPPSNVLTRICYSSSSFRARATLSPPSWSWMAYMGEINYLRLDFGKVEWVELSSPWSSRADGRQSAHTDDRSAVTTLEGEVRDIVDSRQGRDQTQGQLYFDMTGSGGGAVDTSVLRCVVLGVDRGKESLSAKLHYFILVALKTSRERDGGRVYERIGVGYLPGRCISAGEGERIRIR